MLAIERGFPLGGKLFRDGLVSRHAPEVSELVKNCVDVAPGTHAAVELLAVEDRQYRSAGRNHRVIPHRERYACATKRMKFKARFFPRRGSTGHHDSPVCRMFDLGDDVVGQSNRLRALLFCHAICRNEDGRGSTPGCVALRHSQADLVLVLVNLSTAECFRPADPQLVLVPPPFVSAWRQAWAELALHRCRCTVDVSLYNRDVPEAISDNLARKDSDPDVERLVCRLLRHRGKRRRKNEQKGGVCDETSHQVLLEPRRVAFWGACYHVNASFTVHCLELRAGTRIAAPCHTSSRDPRSIVLKSPPVTVFSTAEPF